MNGFSFFGKVIILIGIFLIILGGLMIYGERIPFIGKLPGDIHIKRENFNFYFPITTCILISMILTLLFYLIQRFR